MAKKYIDIGLGELQKLLIGKIHEHRLIVLIILVEKYKKADKVSKKRIVNFYLKNLKHVNNWDLVDLSAEYILGGYLLNRDKLLLYKLAKSDNLWERRVAIVSTFAFIKKNKFKETFTICRMLLSDKHDLIHKACGWMLKRNLSF